MIFGFTWTSLLKNGDSAMSHGEARHRREWISTGFRKDRKSSGNGSVSGEFGEKTNGDPFHPNNFDLPVPP